MLFGFGYIGTGFDSRVRLRFIFSFIPNLALTSLTDRLEPAAFLVKLPSGFELFAARARLTIYFHI